MATLNRRYVEGASGLATVLENYSPVVAAFDMKVTRRWEEREPDYSSLYIEREEGLQETPTSGKIIICHGQICHGPNSDKINTGIITDYLGKKFCHGFATISCVKIFDTGLL